MCIFAAQMFSMKDNSPLVSIIMAVKDTEPYLPDCLDSILSQTYHNWELIAVNDHSTDRSPEILNDYANLMDLDRMHYPAISPQTSL